VIVFTYEQEENSEDPELHIPFKKVELAFDDTESPDAEAILEHFRDFLTALGYHPETVSKIRFAGGKR
jgi:hypothetical protein